VEKEFRWRDSQIAYTEFGNGSNILIAFHGYGQRGNIFINFSSALSNTYRVISIDLPHQGGTIWRETEELGIEDLEDLIRSLMRFLDVKDKISLMAYSIGGNYALGLAATCPSIVKEIWLIGADGLESRKWLYWALRTSMGKWFFRRIINNPKRAFALLSAMRRWNILDEKVYKFYMSNFDTKSKRAQLFKRWTSASRMNYRSSSINDLVNQYGIKVKMIYGRFDKVIPLKRAIRFHRKVSTSQLLVLDQGHDLVKEQNAVSIKKLID